jgi:DNA primase
MPGMFDRATVNQVLHANDIVDVVSEHLSLTKKGREMVGVCPFHDDHRPSLYVNADKQIFKCFACSAGGSVFTFIQMRENLSFPQAVERLAQRAGIDVTPTRRPSGQAKESHEIDPNTLAKLNAWAAKHFRQNLTKSKQGKQALDYLAQRQITDQSAEKWQLGLAPRAGDHLIQAAGSGIPQKLLAQAGLAVGQPGSANLGDKFVNRLMFPITDVTARVIGFGGRTLDDNGAKYINSPTTALFDKSNSLYGLHHARHHIVSSGTAVVVEGYTDCIMAHQFGCTNVVAALGTSFTEGHARILRRYAKKLVLVFDSDAAGAAAANRALDVCLAQRIDIKLATVPEEKDPCDFLLAAGEERFDKLIDSAVDVLEFKWNQLKETFGHDATFTDTKAAVDQFLNTIAASLSTGQLSAIETGLLVNRLSNIIAIDNKEINRQLSRRTTRTTRASKPAANVIENQKVSTGELGGLFATAQREVLEVLLCKPGLYESVRQELTPDIFDAPNLRQIATVLFEALNSGNSPSLNQLSAATESVEASRLIVELAQTAEKKDKFELRLTEAVNAIRRHLARMKKPEIRTKQDLKRLSEDTNKVNPHTVGMV